MRALTLREKIGQLIVTGFSGTNVSESIKHLVADYKVGNIILFSRNVESALQLHNLCADLRTMVNEHTGIPAFIAIDQEGGRVTRLPPDAANIPGALAIASTDRPELAYTAGRITARELLALGVSFNLAPVLDINNNRLNPVINVRSYGDKAETVEQYGLMMVKGLQDEGILAAVKHFPGHGDTSVDSHIGLPVINKTLEHLYDLELRPFQQAIASGVECIMSSHILFPLIEQENLPATMSRTIITDVLKNRLGYQGLIVTDCLEMDAIRKYYGTAEGALRALQAGVHMLFISHTPELVIAAIEKIEQAVESGELSIETIDEAVHKVMHFKKKYTEPAHRPPLSVVGCEPHRRAVAAMSLESICHIKGKLQHIRDGADDVLVIGCKPYRTDLASSDAADGLSFADLLAERLSVRGVQMGLNPDASEIASIMRIAAGYRHVVVGLFHAQENEGQLALVRALQEKGREVTAVAMGKPYDLALLDDEVCSLAAFEYTPLAILSVAAILSGEAAPSGRLKITL